MRLARSSCCAAALVCALAFAPRAEGSHLVPRYEIRTTYCYYRNYLDPAYVVGLQTQMPTMYAVNQRSGVRDTQQVRVRTDLWWWNNVSSGYEFNTATGSWVRRRTMNLLRSSSTSAQAQISFGGSTTSSCSRIPAGIRLRSSSFGRATARCMDTPSDTRVPFTTPATSTGRLATSHSPERFAASRCAYANAQEPA